MKSAWMLCLLGCLSVGLDSCAGTPFKREGVWIFDAKGTEASVLRHPAPANGRKIADWFVYASPFVVGKKFSFQGGRVVVSVLHHARGIEYRLSAVDGDKMEYKITDPPDRGPKSLIVIARFGEPVRILYPQIPEMAALRWKRVSAEALPKTDEEFIALVREWRASVKKIVEHLDPGRPR